MERSTTGEAEMEVDDVECSKSAINQWSVVKPFGGCQPPKQRSLHASIVVGDCLYIFGGYDGSSRVNDFYKFSFKASKWSQIHPAGSSPTARDRHVVVSYAEKIYIFAGYDGNNRVNDFWQYDTEHEVWSTVDPALGNPPTPRHSHSGVEYDGSMYIFAGYDGNYRSDFHRYNFPQRKWSIVPVKGSVPKARYRTSAVAYKNRMLVVGGHDGAKHLNDFYQFNFDTLEWSMVETTGQVPPPSPRDSHSAVICGDSMYLFGGSTGSARNDLYAFSFETDQWTEVRTTPGATQKSNVPCPRFCHTCDVYNNSLYVFGGYDGQQRLNDFWQFKLATEVNIDIPSSSLVSDLREFLNDAKLSDVTFIVEGKPVYAHKLLCMRCSYFRAMFEGQMREAQQKTITINNVSHRVFLALLEYLYTDEFEISMDIAMDLFVAADQFGIDRLKRLCEKKILVSINIDSAATILQAANMHIANDLRQSCMDFILRNFDAVSKTLAFEATKFEPPGTPLLRKRFQDEKGDGPIQCGARFRNLEAPVKAQRRPCIFGLVPQAAPVAGHFDALQPFASAAAPPRERQGVSPRGEKWLRPQAWSPWSSSRSRWSQTTAASSDCQERVFDTEKGVEQVVLGLYVIRGDNLVIPLGTRFRAIRGCAACCRALGAGLRWSEALDLIQSPGVALSEVALSCTIRAAGAAHRWQVATRLLEQMEDLSVESSAFSFSAGIDACAKASQWRQAVGIFMSMPVTSTRCNEICLNAALAACQRASRWRQALALGAWAEGQDVAVDDAGHHILLCALEAVGHWAAALALLTSRQPPSPAALDAATLAACRARRWQEALILGHAALTKPQPGRHGEVLGALACLCEEQGHPAGRQLFHDLAKAAHTSGLGGLSQALATASSWQGDWTPLDVAAKLRGMLGAGSITGRLPYKKEVALLRKVVEQANPGDAASVVHQMECFGVELGNAGGWAKFAAGSKAQILLLGAAGAGPSPKHVLDIGAYGGGSALHLAMALPGVHVTAVELDPVMVALARCLLGFAGVGDRVRVLPGHTRLRLPGLQGQRFAGIFADVWGAQYADVLALIHRHALLSTGSVLIVDNVLRTGAAEFAGRVTTGQGFHTVVMPVREVANPEEEDWMTVSVLRDAAVWETNVSDELLELQARSEHLRDEATNEGIAPEEHQDFSERAREVFRKVGIVPVDSSS
eukprot:s1607_g4.t1